MRILKHGISAPLFVGKCSVCGCEFEATRNEVAVCPDCPDSERAVARCPECHAHGVGVVRKGFPVSDTTESHIEDMAERILALVEEIQRNLPK